MNSPRAGTDASVIPSFPETLILLSTNININIQII
jgi:hypothetical protein